MDQSRVKIALAWLLCRGAHSEPANPKGSETCPCVEWSGTGLDKYMQNGKLIYTPAGGSTSYEYPSGYGHVDCQAHDKDMPPFCNRPNAPAWCTQEWCFVDIANCGLQYYDSSYFPGAAYYSYDTCGSANSFTTWYEAGQEGSSAIRVVDILEGYLWSSRRLLEDTYMQLTTQLPSANCEFSTMCPCYECIQNEAWNSKIDIGDVGAYTKPGVSQELERITSCLHNGIAQGYSKVAAKESEAGKRIGWQYYGDQPTGSHAWWPNVDWCPKDYDPRLRPWYAAGSSGPKDVVIVVDVSGSMQKEGRSTLSQEAVDALLDTLEWKDYASIVLFNHAISAQYSEKMVPVDACQRQKMKSWVQAQNFADGGTEFRVSLDRAFDIIEASVSAGETTMCQKAILFLTDGKAKFSDQDYLQIQEKAKRFDTTIFSYTLGNSADKSVAKKLACDNGGVFYPVPDGGDLKHIMAQYYSFFSSGQEVCIPAFTRYEDVVTGAELWPACLPIYDRTRSQAQLLGVTCMDLNVMADPKDMRKESMWSDFTCKVSDMTKKCRPMFLTECSREKIRREYSEESVCNAQDMNWTKPCPCIDPSCKDDDEWIDELGYFCDTWIGDDCQKAQEQWGYTWEGTQQVLRKCRRSCGLCPAQDPCPYSTASMCQGHTFSAEASTCRACRTSKVSGLDIEGKPMCCRADSTKTCPESSTVCGPDVIISENKAPSLEIGFVWVLLCVSVVMVTTDRCLT
eukprot:TRINITY_DN76124_c0_g1_i1.p1 TRINITY_DN76124_c0_g1~~TRINITY_DN76124_c0_g1_i1.p1  ORF type:complete len:753 (+),score=104.63 TRINITY_DN76124_c0_g1_i1:49-2259(+)